MKAEPLCVKHKRVRTKISNKNLDRFQAPTIHCLPPYLNHYNNGPAVDQIFILSLCKQFYYVSL